MAAGFKTATVNATDVPSTLSNYPAFVDLSRLGITTLAEAQSVRVYANSTKATEWAREIVSATQMWVKIPSLTSTTSIYVDWDGVSSDYAVTDTYGRNAVWSDYEIVAHMEEVPTNTQVNSTGKTGGTYNGSMVAGDSVTGYFGNALDFDGTNDELSFSVSTAQDFQANDNYNISYWIKTTENTQSNIIENRTSSTVPFFSNTIEATGRIGMFTRTSSTRRAYVTFTTAVNDGSWHRVNITRNGSLDGNASAFTANIDGSADSQSAATTDAAGGTSTYSSSGTVRVAGGFNGFANTQLDEFRIGNNNLSDDWMSTEYNNQADEAGFWGTWSDVGSSGPVVTNQYTATQTGVGSTLVIPSVTVAAGEGLVVNTSMRDGGANVTSVVWDAAGVNEALTENVELVSNFQAGIYTIASPTAKTASVTITYSASRDRPKIGTAYTVSGHDTTTMVEATGSNNDTGTAITQSITTLSNNALVIDCGVQLSDATNPVVTPGSGQTQTINQEVQGTTFGGKMFQSYKTVATAGATTMTWTSTNSLQYTNASIAIKPAAGGGGGYRFVPQIRPFAGF